MMMDAARRSLRELFDRAISGARGKGPEIAGVEGAVRRTYAESHGDPIFQDQCGARGRNRDIPGASCGVQVNPYGCLVLFIDLAGLVPALNASMARRSGLIVAVYGETRRVNRMVQRDRLAREIKTVNLVQLAGLTVQLQIVVNNFNPVSRR